MSEWYRMVKTLQGGAATLVGLETTVFQAKQCNENLGNALVMSLSWKRHNFRLVLFLETGLSSGFPSGTYVLQAL
jgi:hypothetical protein